jgi:hypothetical protein
MGRKREFSILQKQFIIDNYLKLSSNDIAKLFAVTVDCVARFKRQMGLIVPKHVSNQFRSSKNSARTSAKNSDDIFLKSNYLTLPVKTLSDKLGRSETFVKVRLRQLGLIIPPEIIERNKQSARLKKGNVPFNKGRKQADYMDPEMIARSTGTRFKKGNLPPNTCDSDGEIRIRRSKRGNKKAYQYIRLSLGVWKGLHIHLWEKENGKLPAGHCLWFKDGDTMNVTLDNLELITRKENYLRNSGHTLLNDTFVASLISPRDRDLRKQILTSHPEIIDIKRQDILLARKIKSVE